MTAGLELKAEMFLGIDHVDSEDDEAVVESNRIQTREPLFTGDEK